MTLKNDNDMEDKDLVKHVMGLMEDVNDERLKDQRKKHGEAQKRYYRRNKEKMREYNRGWIKRNPEYMKKWRTDNPDKVKIYSDKKKVEWKNKKK